MKMKKNTNEKEKKMQIKKSSYSCKITKNQDNFVVAWTHKLWKLNENKKKLEIKIKMKINNKWKIANANKK